MHWWSQPQGDDLPDDAYITVADVEKAAAAAAADPDHDWRIYFFAPMYEAEYQRQGENQWVLIKKGDGFA